MTFRNTHTQPPARTVLPRTRTLEKDTRETSARRRVRIRCTGVDAGDKPADSPADPVHMSGHSGMPWHKTLPRNKTHKARGER
eukprot:6196503-Prymnesium_polylepis.1